MRTLAATRPPHRPGARYTRPEVDVLAEVRELLAVAVAADRAAGDGWPEIGRALGVSADTGGRQ
ncbi:hypothetical protein [Streptomyces sp. NPDC046909]|uniref:hypothetical protein n=1 Tax=Streptomyces sp. NPDC046909 TaxID=3155617 RepID=UPI003408CB90